MMRTSVLQPLADLIEINERQAAIQVLIEHEIEMQDLREAMIKFPDVDNFISKLVRRENSLDPKNGEDLIHRALTLKSIIRKVKNLEGTLKRIASGSLLSSIVEVL
jgi:DNA mismatch repair ATPase MutS